MNSRTIATLILKEVIVEGHSLTFAFKKYRTQLQTSQEASLIQEICYGVCRWYPRLVALAQLLLSKPLKPKDHNIYILILVGFYQLLYLTKAEHAVINETVNATRELNKPWASQLVNGLLRTLQREADHYLQQLDNDPVARYAHPNWLLDTIHQTWPQDWQAIVHSNNQKPPMILRVNLLKTIRAAYLQLLQQQQIAAEPLAETNTAIIVKQPIPMADLPGYADGVVSVQNLSAQLVADLLELTPGQRVLDACAAPGNKTAHLLESQPELKELIAIDNSPERIHSLQTNLKRLQLSANVQCTDATQPKQWWDNKHFDRILIDAPCTGTGVIRRHPDIKLLRKPTDIKQLQAQQIKIVTALWPLLKSNGLLLYTTCSILPDENQFVVEQFLQQHKDAKVVDIVVP